MIGNPNKGAARRKHRVILRKRTVCERVGLSGAQVWRKSVDPKDDFPESIVLGPNAVGWYENEVSEWVNSRPRGVVPWKAKLREYQDQRIKEPQQAGQEQVMTPLPSPT